VIYTINKINAETLEQAIADGDLVELFKDCQDPPAPDGKPILATRAVSDSIHLDLLDYEWALYMAWRRTVKPTLPEEEQGVYVTAIVSREVWIVKEAEAFIILFPWEC
jgi:hypothetical protein